MQGRLAEKWTVSPDGLKATFVLREGIKSNWGNTLSAEDVKWTWDRKFHLKGQGTFQVSAVGLKTPDQVKIEGPNVVSFNLLKPNPVLLKQQCNLANPIYDSVKLMQVGGAGDPWGTEFLKNETSHSARTDCRSLYVASRPYSSPARTTGTPNRSWKQSLCARCLPRQAAYRCCREARSISRNSWSRARSWR